MGVARSLPGAKAVLVLDFCASPLDAGTAKAYQTVPKRKDGTPDRRYRLSQHWRFYVAEQNKRAQDAYVAGDDLTSFRPDPWELPR